MCCTGHGWSAGYLQPLNEAEQAENVHACVQQSCRSVAWAFKQGIEAAGAVKCLPAAASTLQLDKAYSAVTGSHKSGLVRQGLL